VPTAPRRPCSHPGCNALTDYGRCERHKKQDRQERDKRRGSAHSRGYTARWGKARDVYLAQHPLCIACHNQGIVQAAQVVDHIIPHKGDYDLFWDVDNWQPLCATHHNAKTNSMDGGFGNKRR
jgi:5-methylcytosine-specific restriction protein A